jgi:L-Ala-D/L-Glu epimerase
MRLVSATLYALQIPFTESFAHSTKERTSCDSVVVRVCDEAGIEGFGEGVPRPYVTGETPESVMTHLADDLWPAVAGREAPSIAEAGLTSVDAFIPEKPVVGVLSDHASRAALELAILDCVLRSHQMSVAQVMPPRRQKIVYSGIITAGSLETAVRHARQMKLVGLEHIKVKVGMDDDFDRLHAIRGVFGPRASLRVDANGAWTVEQAAEALNRMAVLNIDSVEQPLPRGPVAELRRLRQLIRVPVMVDESLVTLADTDELIEARAVDYFNIRVSKCGGLARSLEIARRGLRAGIRLQVGAQVGETAILSAAGRHLAAALPDVAFVEGSYGSMLLTEDISLDGIRFGHRGVAPILTGPGLGVRVLEDQLRKYAVRVVELNAR